MQVQLGDASLSNSTRFGFSNLSLMLDDAAEATMFLFQHTQYHEIGFCPQNPRPFNICHLAQQMDIVNQRS